MNTDFLTTDRYDPDWKKNLSPKALEMIATQEMMIRQDITDDMTFGMFVPMFAGVTSPQQFDFDPADPDDGESDSPHAAYIRAHVYADLRSRGEFPNRWIETFVHVTCFGHIILYSVLTLDDMVKIGRKKTTSDWMEDMAEDKDEFPEFGRSFPNRHEDPFAKYPFEDDDDDLTVLLNGMMAGMHSQAGDASAKQVPPFIGKMLETHMDAGINQIEFGATPDEFDDPLIEFLRNDVRESLGDRMKSNDVYVAEFNRRLSGIQINVRYKDVPSGNNPGREANLPDEPDLDFLKDALKRMGLNAQVIDLGGLGGPRNLADDLIPNEVLDKLLDQGIEECPNCNKPTCQITEALQRRKRERETGNESHRKGNGLDDDFLRAMGMGNPQRRRSSSSSPKGGLDDILKAILGGKRTQPSQLTRGDVETAIENSIVKAINSKRLRSEIVKMLAEAVALGISSLITAMILTFFAVLWALVSRPIKFLWKWILKPTLTVLTFVNLPWLFMLWLGGTFWLSDFFSAAAMGWGVWAISHYLYGFLYGRRSGSVRMDIPSYMIIVAGMTHRMAISNWWSNLKYRWVTRMKAVITSSEARFDVTTDHKPYSDVWLVRLTAKVIEMFDDLWFDLRMVWVTFSDSDEYRIVLDPPIVERWFIVLTARISRFLRVEVPLLADALLDRNHRLMIIADQNTYAVRYVRMAKLGHWAQMKRTGVIRFAIRHRIDRFVWLLATEDKNRVYAREHNPPLWPDRAALRSYAVWQWLKKAFARARGFFIWMFVDRDAGEQT